MGNALAPDTSVRVDNGLDKVRKRAVSKGGVNVTVRYHRAGQRDISDDYVQESKVLGSGLNGQVYLAKSKTRKNMYAVKPLKLHGISRQERQHLELECEIFLAMDHPNIGRLVDVYETEEELKLVMECMEGGEVLGRIQKKEAFTNSEAQSTVRQMLLAINYMHGQKIVHRDIKLQNFLYARESDDELKLIDFGFGSFVHKNRSMIAACGTLSYMAPEVVKRNYDSQCDLWSLGVVTFALLGGYMPFQGNKDTLLRLICENEYDWREEKWKHVPAEGQDFVKALLVVDPRSRMTAQQALEHPWLKTTRHDAFSTETVEALHAFQKASHFKKVCLRAMAWSLTQEERHELREVFLAADQDGQGTISLQEFQAAMKSTLIIEDESLDELWESLKGLGSHSSDDVYYSDFLAAMCAKRVSMHETLLMDTFKRFDSDNSGHISPEDLSAILGSQAEAAEMMRVADTSGDDRISFDEFVNLITLDTARQSQADLLSKVIDKQLTVRPALERTRSIRSKTAADARQSPKAAIADRRRAETSCCVCFTGLKRDGNR